MKTLNLDLKTCVVKINENMKKTHKKKKENVTREGAPNRKENQKKKRKRARRRAPADAHAQNSNVVLIVTLLQV